MKRQLQTLDNFFGSLEPRTKIFAWTKGKETFFIQRLFQSVNPPQPLLLKVITWALSYRHKYCIHPATSMDSSWLDPIIYIYLLNITHNAHSVRIYEAVMWAAIFLYYNIPYSILYVPLGIHHNLLFWKQSFWKQSNWNEVCVFQIWKYNTMVIFKIWCIH